VARGGECAKQGLRFVPLRDYKHRAKSMSDTNPTHLPTYTTLEETYSAIRRGVPYTTALARSRPLQKRIAERRQLEQLAVPLFKEMLSSVPYYAARIHDERFWCNYVSSRWTLAMEMVEDHLCSTTPSGASADR